MTAGGRWFPGRAGRCPAPHPGPHPALDTRFCRLVGVRYPIVQTGMGWVAGPRLVAATAEAGGLGILASATMTYAELTTAIAEVRSRTDRPFGVNLRTDVADVGERVALMIDNGVTVASFAQAPSADLVDRCRRAGLVVMPTVGARRHAEKMAEWGVDAVIAQGGEGGGHTGSVPTSLLTPAVVDAVGDRVAVAAAGGFFDGRGLVAAVAFGAVGVAMGTRFLLTRESRGSRRGQGGLPGYPGDRNGGVHGRRRGAPTGHPHRDDRRAREVARPAAVPAGRVERREVRAAGGRVAARRSPGRDSRCDVTRT